MFKYGRTDCPTSPMGEVVSFPGGEWGYDQVIAWYRDYFNMNEREATVLTGGGHAIGGAFSLGWFGLWQQSEFELFGSLLRFLCVCIAVLLREH